MKPLKADDPANVKAEQHARYDEMCKAVVKGELEFKPAQKSQYSLSVSNKFTAQDYFGTEDTERMRQAKYNIEAKGCADDFQLDIVEKYPVYDRKEPIKILGTILDNPDCPVCISLDEDWEGITLTQGAGWMDNEGDIIYIQGVENLTKLRDMLNHVLKDK